MNAALDRDVVILGGGLAGLTLGLQLKQTRPDTRVTVLERSRFPMPEATHKVGESTVEIAATYFGRDLGLRDLLDATHLPKLGLRFFFDDGRNDDIAARHALGPTDFLPVRSWQVDRGRFENQLAERAAAAGVEVVDGAKVTDVELGGPHRVRFEDQGTERTLTSRWVADASGRRALLKRQLGLARPVPHDTNAAWFRVSDTLDLDTWSSDVAYRGWVDQPRRLSTNHLLGEGYWVWLIPLPGGSTSVGVVTDGRLHPFSTIRSRDAARRWLATHEPQVGDAIAGPFDDFGVLKHYTHSSRRVFHPTGRWGLVGDAGIFLDPFYSPGSDFIGMANTLLTDGICADLDGRPDAEARLGDWNARLLLMFRAFLPTFRDRYPMMGRPTPMRAKIAWDFAFYWSTWAQLFSSGRLTDRAFLRRIDPIFRDLFGLTVGMQSLFGRWGDAAPRHELGGPQRWAYSEQPWLQTLNGELLDAADLDDDALEARLRNNAARLRAVAGELEAAAMKHHPKVGGAGLDLTQDSTHMAWLGL